MDQDYEIARDRMAEMRARLADSRDTPCKL